MNKKNNISIILLSIFICISCFSLYSCGEDLSVGEKPSISEINLFVSTNGSDSNDGSKEKPFKTLEAARDNVRDLLTDKSLNNTTININIREGTYYIEDTLELGADDSGNDSVHIVYKSYNNEEVILTGAVDLDINDFEKVTDVNILNRFIDKKSSKNILQYDLKTNDIYNGDIDFNIINSPELFLNNNPMTIAKWPNEDYLLTETVIADEDDSFTFEFTNSRMSLWEDVTDIWMFGYWYFNWKDDSIKIDSIDLTNNQIKSSKNATYGIQENQRFYFFNILEELDSPGEYYIDRESEILYFYPPDNATDFKLQLSYFNDQFITIENANNITIDGLIIEGSQDDTMQIIDCNNVLVTNCTIRNTSKSAIIISDGFNVGVSNSKIYNTGTGGIYIDGGDRDTLTSSNHYVKNTEISNFSRLQRCYSPAINIEGVGITVSNNLIYDGPHTAIVFSGNNNSIEYNEIHSVGQETDDLGAIYSGRDWTYRGNKINYNYIHNLGNELSDHGIGGIYLDDCMSSAEVYGNIFYEVDTPLFIGGGRDHIISNNLILDCNKSIYFDDRGLSWNLDELYDGLDSVDYTNNIWKTAYPELYNTDENDFGTPANNTISNNILYKSGDFDISQSVIDNGTIKSNNTIDDSIELNQLENEINTNRNFSYFKAIDFNKIGLNK